MTLSQKATKAGRSKAAKARKTLTADELFFYEHAGYSYGKGEMPEQGRIQCAKDLALAESGGQAKGWAYEWIWDECPDLSWMDEEERTKEHEVLVCLLLDREPTGHDSHGWPTGAKVLQSLGNITDPDRNYSRVVEAELADEQLAVEAKHAESIRAAVEEMN
jgi:hypothetical protein